MAEKHVAVCDQCGVEEPLQGGGIEYRWKSDLPDGWVIVALAAPFGQTTILSGKNGPGHFCSWHCVAHYAVARQADADRGEPLGAVARG